MYSISILLSGVFFIIAATNIRVNRKKDEMLLTIMLVIVFSIIMANRSAEIPDTMWYQFSFTDIDAYQKFIFSLFRDNSRYGFEYGFIWLMQLFKRFISVDYHSFFFFCSIIISTLFIYAVKEIYMTLVEEQDVNYPLLFSIYTGYFGLYYCGIAIRAGLAMGLILLGVVYVLKKKYIPALVLLFIAFTLQRTSIIGLGLLLVILFFHLKISKKTITIIWFVIGTLIFSGIAEKLFTYTLNIFEFIFTKYSVLDYSRYLLRGKQTSEAGIAVFLDWLIGLIIILFIYDDEKISRLFNVYLVGFLIIVFTLTIPGFNRMSDYFIVVNIPMMYHFATTRKINKYIRIIVCVAVVTLNIIRVLNRYGWV